MEKVLEIDIDSKEDLFEQYNGRKVSRYLIQYMVDAMPILKNNDTLKVVINNRLKDKKRTAEIIKQALDEACAKSDFRFHSTNTRQIIFSFFGILGLIFASLISNAILSEIIIIGAWVLLWEVVELEIDDDIKNFKRKRKLKKMLQSEFIEIIE